MLNPSSSMFCLIETSNNVACSQISPFISGISETHTIHIHFGKEYIKFHRAYKTWTTHTGNKLQAPYAAYAKWKTKFKSQWSS